MGVGFFFFFFFFAAEFGGFLSFCCVVEGPILFSPKGGLFYMKAIQFTLLIVEINLLLVSEIVLQSCVVRKYVNRFTQFCLAILGLWEIEFSKRKRIFHN